MTTKPVGFSAHAENRIREYEIRRGDVRGLMATARRVSVGGGYFEVEGKLRCKVAGVVRGRKALVAYHEDAQRILIVTVMPVLTPHELERLREFRRKRKEKQ